jgi:hypothetical protein
VLPSFARGLLCTCSKFNTGCRAIGGCTNEARYHVRQYDVTWLALFCGLHDLEHNGGRGKLSRELQP